MPKIVAIGTHPDDESLGCGGTLLKHKANGDEVYWVIVTAIKEQYGFSPDAVKRRQEEIETVSSLYAFDGVYCLDFPTMRLDEIPFRVIIGSIADVFKKVDPNIVYLPFKSDIHTDHQVVFRAAYSCTKNFRCPSIGKIVMMEIMSETEFAPATTEDSFVPNVFVDITEFIERKIEIINVYTSELSSHPFPRSERNIRALATFRGATAGFNYAEGFMLLKECL